MAKLFKSSSAMLDWPAAPGSKWSMAARETLPQNIRGCRDGGDEEDRTPDLRIANATLSQLSYAPKFHDEFTIALLRLVTHRPQSRGAPQRC